MLNLGVAFSRLDGLPLYGLTFPGTVFFCRELNVYQLVVSYYPRTRALVNYLGFFLIFFRANKVFSFVSLLLLLEVDSDLSIRFLHMIGISKVEVLISKQKRARELLLQEINTETFDISISCKNCIIKRNFAFQTIKITASAMKYDDKWCHKYVGHANFM